MRLILLFVFLPTLFAACGSPEKTKVESKAEEATVETVISNPLDSILGDKVSEDGKTIIRRDNFESLRKISVTNLKDPAALYKVEQISPTHFLVKQKKGYLFARTFSIIAECRGDSIANFYPLNDYNISKCLPVADGIILFADDCNNANMFLWKKTGNILIQKLDSDLKLKWDYQPEKPPNAFFAKDFEINNHKLIFQIEFFTGSTMLPAHVLELTLDYKGKYVSSSHLIFPDQAELIPAEKLRKILANHL